MKNKHKYGIFFLFINICFNSGCATNTAVSPEDAKVPLKPFIRKEFTRNSQLSAILDKLPGKGKPKTLDDYNMEGNPLGDGTYVYFAPYNADNINFLEKPRKKLNNYCAAQGGIFKVFSYYQKDIISQFEADPIQAYFKTRAYLDSPNFPIKSVAFDTGVAGTIDLPVTKTIKNSIAINSYNEAKKYNRANDISDAEKGYALAAQAGYFGYFGCTDHNKNILWGVSILPIAFLGADHEHFMTEAIYLGIRPYS